jgi:hypothetical protein
MKSVAGQQAGVMNQSIANGVSTPFFFTPFLRAQAYRS